MHRASNSDGSNVRFPMFCATVPETFEGRQWAHSGRLAGAHCRAECRPMRTGSASIVHRRVDPLETVANDRSENYQSNGSAHLEHFSFAIQSRTSGAGLPPHPGPTTFVPQWEHLMRLTRINTIPNSNNGDTLRVAHSGGTIRSSKAKSRNIAATARNAISDFFLGLSVPIEPPWFIVRHP
jgi:hypothetical protein